MNKSIAANAIVVAAFGTIISAYIGWKNHSWSGFAIMMAITIIAAILVNFVEKRSS